MRLASKAGLAATPFARATAAPLALPAPRLYAASWQAMDTPAAGREWDALASCAAEPNPFFESCYLLPSLRTLDPHGEVQLLRFDCDGILAGLLPVARERRYYRWPIPHVRSWIHANCFLGIPLVRAGMERAFWRALLEWADANAGTTLFLHLSHLPLEGPL